MLSIDEFCSNIDNLQNNIIDLSAKEIRNIFFMALKEMANLTVEDTGQAKSAFIDIFKDKGMDISDVDINVYDYWGNDDRGIGLADTSYSESIDKNSLEGNLEINDKGVFRQEAGLPPSENVKDIQGNYRDNSNYKIGHITYVTENFDRLNEFNNIVERILDNIEDILFKK